MIFYKYMGHRNKNGSVDKYWGELKQKHKKNSLLAMPVLRTCRQHCGMSDFKPRLESATPQP